MAQINYRLNPKPSYSERMTDTRAELRRLIKEELCQITQDASATMSWSHRSYMKKVVMRYRVRIEGWPLADVPFRNLSNVPNLGSLEMLLHGWKEGSILFVRLADEQYHSMLADPTPWIGPAVGGAPEEEEETED